MAARWRIGVQADPLGVQTWSTASALAVLHQAGEAEVHVLSRRMPSSVASLWLEVEDREVGERRSILLDAVDHATTLDPRAASADTIWKRGYVEGRGRPYGLVLDTWFGSLPRAYRARGVAAGLRNRKLVDVRWMLARGYVPPLVTDLELPPGGEERVLFQVRAWEPTGTDPAGRLAVNEGRAATIRALREALGRRFVGGFVASPYAREHHPDLLSDGAADRAGYQALIASCAIGVSTVGLHGSNGHKLAEYLAASRAIVTEPLRQQLPEPVDDVMAVCADLEAIVDTCTRLLDDPQARQHLQERAHEHWARCVRPDQLLRRRLAEEFVPDQPTPTS